MAKDFNEYPDDEDIHEGRGWLPTWWTVMLWGGFIIAVVYSVYVHGVLGWSQGAGYQEEIANFEKEHPQIEVSLTDDGVNPYRGDADAIAGGEKVFAATCAACHKADMTGLIGPSLADKAWLHGSSDAKVYEVIMEGVLDANNWKQQPPKGPMPPHKTSLGGQKVLQVMAFIASKNETLKEK